MRCLSFLLLVVAGGACAQQTPVLTAEQITTLEEKVKAAPSDNEAALSLGRNYAWAIMHVTQVNQHNLPISVDPKLASGPAALHARRALSASNHATVIGEAGYTLRLKPPVWAARAKRDAALESYGEDLINRAVELAPEDGRWRELCIVVLYLHATHPSRPIDAAKALAAVERHLAHTAECWKQGSLSYATKLAVRAGELDKAETWATELLLRGKEQLCHYGNALYDGNLVLGQVALRRDGDATKAKWFLMESARTPSSANLHSFGPNMSLARDLLERGERDSVLQFLAQCRTFWKMGEKSLDQWISDVRRGKTPNFGASLVY